MCLSTLTQPQPFFTFQGQTRWSTRMGNICFKSPPRLHVADSSPINVKGNNDSNPIKADLDTTSQMPNNAIDGCETPLITSVSNHKHQHKTDYAHDIHQNLVKMLIPKKIKSYIPFLATSWPGSILNWSKDDIETFASCFTVRHHNEGEEVGDQYDKCIGL